MEEKVPEERQLIKIEEVSLERMSLEQKRRAEQLYNQLGLDPIVDEVLKGYPEALSRFDRVTDKMFGPYDVKGRAEAIAKITALVTYAALSEQYDKEAGKLESQITALEGEREQVTTNYDELVNYLSWSNCESPAKTHKFGKRSLRMHDNLGMKILCIDCALPVMKETDKADIADITPAQADEIEEYLDFF